MKNLKITFNLKNGAILNRFTTIDSILLVHHYALQRELGNVPKDRFIETKDDLENLSKWLEVKNGVLSGSISALIAAKIAEKRRKRAERKVAEAKILANKAQAYLDRMNSYFSDAVIRENFANEDLGNIEASL